LCSIDPPCWIVNREKGEGEEVRKRVTREEEVVGELERTWRGRRGGTRRRTGPTLTRTILKARRNFRMLKTRKKVRTCRQSNILMSNESMLFRSHDDAQTALKNLKEMFFPLLDPEIGSSV